MGHDEMHYKRFYIPRLASLIEHENMVYLSQISFYFNIAEYALLLFCPNYT